MVSSDGNIFLPIAQISTDLSYEDSLKNSGAMYGYVPNVVWSISF